VGAEDIVGVCENGHPAGADDKFCRACGAAIQSPVVCENGHTVPEGKKFCPECGAAVAAKPQRPLAGPRLKAWFVGLSRASMVGLFGGMAVVVIAVVIALVSSSGGSGGSGVGVTPSTTDPAVQQYLATVRSRRQPIPATFSDDAVVAAGRAACDELNLFQQVGSREFDLATNKAIQALGGTYSVSVLTAVVWGVEYFCPQWKGARDVNLGPPDVISP
jgi:hypothetical protein